MMPFGMPKGVVFSFLFSSFLCHSSASQFVCTEKAQLGMKWELESSHRKASRCRCHLLGKQISHDAAA